MGTYFVKQTGSHCKDVDICLSFRRDNILWPFLLLGILKLRPETEEDG
jgi:hypothetical protein